jgi:uncharacterized protein DUF6588
MTSGSPRRIAAIAIALVSSAPTARAQSGLESAIDQYTATTVKGYIQPLADVLVANLSLGYVVNAAPSGRLSFGFEIVSMAATIGDNLRTYSANTPPGFTPSTVQTPTVFGGSAPTVNGPVPGATYRGADGVYTSQYFPSAAPQIRVGGLFGTEVAVRYVSSTLIPVIDENDFPELRLFGVGIQHSLSRYVPLPVDVSIAASFNSLTFGDIVDLHSNAIGVNVGRSLGVVGVSFGVQSEGGAMNLKYTSNDPNAPGSVDVNLDVARTVRFRGGAALNLGFLKLFGDAAFGDITSYAAGLRFGF